MKPGYKKEAQLRLKVASGHLQGVRRMADEDAYCVDLMKQLSAVQASLERVQRIFLRNHLLTCVSEAVRDERGSISSRSGGGCSGGRLWPGKPLPTATR